MFWGVSSRLHQLSSSCSATSGVVCNGTATLIQRSLLHVVKHGNRKTTCSLSTPVSFAPENHWYGHGVGCRAMFAYYMLVFNTTSLKIVAVGNLACVHSIWQTSSSARKWMNSGQYRSGLTKALAVLPRMTGSASTHWGKSACCHPWRGDGGWFDIDPAWKFM